MDGAVAATVSSLVLYEDDEQWLDNPQDTHQEENVIIQHLCYLLRPPNTPHKSSPNPTPSQSQGSTHQVKEGPPVTEEEDITTLVMIYMEADVLSLITYRLTGRTLTEPLEQAQARHFPLAQTAK